MSDARGWCCDIPVLWQRDALRRLHFERAASVGGGLQETVCAGIQIPECSEELVEGSQKGLGCKGVCVI